MEAVLLISSYLTNLKGRVKIGQTIEVIGRISFYCVLGPLILNIFINYISFFITNDNITNYTDDNGIFSCNKDINMALNAVEYSTVILNTCLKTQVSII